MKLFVLDYVFNRGGNMKRIGPTELIRYKDYLVIDNENYKVVFSTAEEGKNFNRHTDDGVRTLESLINEFKIEDVLYLRQVHSEEIVIDEDVCRNNIIQMEADAIISKTKNIAIGVFTADCVPIILIDEQNKVGAAIHSGWKGTFNSITKKTIIKLKEIYGKDTSNIKAYIGAHIRVCCYEVSEELKEKFINEKEIDKEILFNGRNLNLEECILKDLREEGIKEENIISLEMCTSCSKEIKLHSYRKSEGDYGRLFSFLILK